MLDDETLKYYLQSIEELVSDEEKLVTYSCLANSLCISINLAKHLLELYVKKHENDKLQVSYFLSGINNTRDGIVMDVVEREKVSEWLKNTPTIIAKHIYSVAKVFSSQFDVKSLCLTGNFDNYISQKSNISSDRIIKSSEESLQSLREGAYTKILGNEPKQTIRLKAKVQEPKLSPTAKHVIQENNNKSGDQIQKNSVNNVPQLNGNVEKKSSIATMFAAAAQNNQKLNKNSTNNASNQKAKGIQGFFQKQSKELENNKQHNHTNIQETKPNIKGTDKAIEKEVKREPQKEIEEEAPKKVSDKHIKVEKAVKVSKKADKTTIAVKKGHIKKRKRVICMSDSDSEDQMEVDKDPFEDNTREERVSSEDEVIPATPQPSAVKAVLNTNPINPRKRRKVIDKTYTDEDGYILTKKEVVYESCSEEETTAEIGQIPMKDKETDKKPNVAMNRVNGSPTKAKKSKKAAAPVLGKNKQATLTNFFKKS